MSDTAPSPIDHAAIAAWNRNAFEAAESAFLHAEARKAEGKRPKPTLVHSAPIGPQFDRNRDTGRPYPTAPNIARALAHMRVELWHDTFSGRLMVRGFETTHEIAARAEKEVAAHMAKYPAAYFTEHPDQAAMMRQVVSESASRPKTAVLDDAVMVKLWLRIEREYGFRPGKDYFYDAVSDTARGNPYNPVCDLLDRWQGDWEERVRDAEEDEAAGKDTSDNGRPYLDTWLIDFCGAEDTPFNRQVGALFLMAAVRRARQPGCKFDELIIFESPQGDGKSSMLAMIAQHGMSGLRGEKLDWFTDCVPLTAEPKEVIEQTRGKWIVEIGEMSGMKKADVEHVKGFLARPDDTARASYGRLAETVPRSFICAGTTNSECYLKDLTGNRRFWPVKLGKIDMEGLRSAREQLWGEAASREAKYGASIRLDKKYWSDAAKAQEARQEANPYLDILAEQLGERDGKISKADVYQLLDLKPAQLHQTTQELITAAMKAHGWQPGKARFNGTTLNAFVKGGVAYGEASKHDRPGLSVIWSDTQRRHVIAPGGHADAFTAGLGRKPDAS